MSRETQEPAPASLWTAQQAAVADRHTIDALKMASPVLMERAALCVSAAVEQLAAERGATRVLVLVGPGNNGGDGLAIARQLHGRGRLQVSAALVTAKRNAAAQEQLEWARSHGVRIRETLPDEVSDAVIVDALLGTGSRGAPRGAIEQALRWLEEREPASGGQGGGGGAHKPAVVAVDVPSGIEVDSGAVPSVAARAAVTVTFQRSKIGLHLTPARAFAGRVVVADIGLVEPSTGEGRESIELLDPRVVAGLLASLPEPAHKGHRGHVGVVGGTGGTPGAAVLAGAAALRTGAGLCTLAMSDEQLRRALIESRPELMLADPEDRFVAAADVLVVGPGLTEAREGLDALDREDPRPAVWDASALEDFVVERSAGPRILTPHPGEAARMLARFEDDPSWTNARVQADRLDAARRLAESSGAVVVLKGEGTVVAERERDRLRVAISTTGGPALATAGSGDVLAGAIAALLARGLDPWAAACAGVHVHGLAGDRAAVDGTLALDVAEGLPQALALTRAGELPRGWPRLLRG
ncbi:MAG: NAD(P)H-hydrate dehydratase [Enhygromyxa sp.]